MSALFWLIACVSPIDSVLHQRALKAGPEADCSGIASPDLKGDCSSWKARGQAKAGDHQLAIETCTSMEDAGWQGECWFLVSDASSALPADASALCQKATPFQADCMDHAIQRLAKQLTARPGAEMEAVDELTVLCTQHLGAEGAADRARAMVAAQLELRPHPLNRASFGDADEALVVMTLTQHINNRFCSTKGLDPKMEPEISQALRDAKSIYQCDQPRNKRSPQRK